jgi:signal transduction histidine kinase
MKVILIGVVVLLATATRFSAPGPIPGEVSCDKGVDMQRVQALVKRTAAALKKDQARVLQQINAGDKQWKDGDLYVTVIQGTTVLAHGYWPWMAGQDVGSTRYLNTYPWFKSGQRMAAEKGEGCIQYKFHNPSKSGQVEDKVTYILKVNDQIRVAGGTYLVK